MNIYSIFGPTINYSDSQNSNQNTNPMNFLSSLFSREFNELFQQNQSSTTTQNNAQNNVQNNVPETTNSNTQTSPNVEEVIFYYNDLQPLTTSSGIPLNQMVNISSINTSNNIGEEMCVICHQPIMNDQIIRKLNICSHQFHVHCIDEWLSSNRTCPTCRRELIEDTQETTEQQRTTLPIYQFRFGRDRTS